MIEWQSIKRPLNQLIPLEDNPRFITETKMERLKQSVDDVGVFKPLVLDFDRKIILAGNMRYRALIEKFPLEHQVDCMIPSRKLTEAEREKVIVMDNAHYGEWDFDILNNVYDVSAIAELDLDIKLPSFEQLPNFDLDESDDTPKSEGDKKFKLEIQLPNELELRDLYDDLTSKGYMVKEL